MFWRIVPFVILLGCGGPPQTTLKSDDVPHLGESWFEFRAKTLAIDISVAKARDAEFNLEKQTVPTAAFDAHTAREAAAIWKHFCAGCHGIDGKPASNLNPSPRKWGGMGPRMGFFFGGDKMRAGIFRKIYNGVLPAMPAWKEQLSQEQIWALVRHIEGF